MAQVIEKCVVLSIFGLIPEPDPGSSPSSGVGGGHRYLQACSREEGTNVLVQLKDGWLRNWAGACTPLLQYPSRPAILFPVTALLYFLPAVVMKYPSRAASR